MNAQGVECMTKQKVVIDSKRIGSALKDVRLSHNKDETDVSTDLNISISRLNCIENGFKSSSLKELIMFANYYCIKIDSIVFYSIE